jgi:hypothetical protein
MSVGHIQQVAQPAAPVVPAFVADAVLQDHEVSAKGPQQCVHFLWRPLRIDLINLRNEMKMEQCTQPSTAWGSNPLSAQATLILPVSLELGGIDMWRIEHI